MVAEDTAVHEAEATQASLWCYLVSLGGQLYALPDDDRTVLLPFISDVPQVTPLPQGLVPPYVMGLINVAQRGELLADLPRLLGLRTGPLAPSMSEGRRIVVIGEARPPEVDEYRLAFAVDYGYELLEATRRMPAGHHPLGAFVHEVIDTPRGEAALLDMEAVCNTLLRDLGAERRWNESPQSLDAEDQ
jgi:chemotaxis signal transduction protein